MAASDLIRRLSSREASRGARGWTLLAALILLAGSGFPASAQEGANTSETVPLQSDRAGSGVTEEGAFSLDYLKVYAPADREDEWKPTGAPAYFPMDPEEFHRLVEKAKAFAAASEFGSGALIRAAEYQARFEGNGLIAGKATLRISHTSPVEARLPLAPCNLAVGQATWKDPGGEAARMGLGADGGLELRVDRRGELEFDWSMQGKPEPLGGVEFDIEFPSCPAIQFLLTLPNDWIPIVQSGVLSIESDQETDTRTWKIELGSANRFSLRVAPKEDPEGHGHFTELRQAVAYTLTPGGLDVAATLRFDIFDQPLRQFQLVLDPSLRLVSVLDGDTPVRWDEVPSGETATKCVVIRPDRPLRGLARELTLTALAPIEFEERFSLPRFTVPEVRWCEGSASLTTQPPLRLMDVALENARVAGVRSRPGRGASNRMDIQLFGSSASVAVLLKREESAFESGGDTEGDDAGERSADLDESRENLDHAKASGTASEASTVPPEMPRYCADIEIAVSVVGKLVTETYVAQIEPESPRLDQVIMETLRRPGSPLHWTHTASGETRLIPGSSAEKAPRDSAESRLERWEVRLRPSRSEPFEIRATRTFPLEEATPVGLACLHGARQQRGRLTIAVSGEDAVHVENRALTAVVPDSASHDPGTVRPATFEFDPRRELVAGTPPVFLRLDSSLPSLPKVLVWDCHVESKLQPTGKARHVATFRIESSGASFFRVDLPRSVSVDQLEAVAVDGRRALIESKVTDRRNQITIRLDNRRFHEVAVCYRTVQGRWPAFKETEILFPEPQAPVLRRDCSVWLPPGYELIEPVRTSVVHQGLEYWPAKAFGLLTASGGEAPIDPLDAKTWLARNDGSRQENRAGDETISETGDSAKTWTWRELLDRSAIMTGLSRFGEGSGKLSFLIDVLAVEQVGVAPQDTVALPEGESSLGQLLRLLDRSGLALAVKGRVIVLTSAKEAAAHGVPIEHDIDGVLWRATAPNVGEEVAGTGAEEEPRSLVTVSEWARFSQSHGFPWKASSKPGRGPRDTTGWNLQRLDVGPSGAVRFYVVDRYVVLSSLWLTFLGVTLLSWSLAARRAVVVFVPLAGFGLAAHYCPDFYVPWLSAGFWGGLAGAVARLVLQRRPPKIVRGSGHLSTVTTQTVAGLLVGGLLSCGAPLEAADQAAKSRLETAGPTLVFIPTEDGEPTGEKYFVPEPFYTRLLGLTSSIDRKKPGWLLKEATYRGRLSWQGERLTLSEFKADFNIEVFGREQPIRIPFGKAVDNWSLVSARLDGREIERAWGDGALAFTTPPTEGSHLELDLRPIPGFGIYSNSFQLTIPALATSRLELAIPPGAPRIEVPSAIGRSTLVREPTRLVVELGPADQLEVNWHATGRSGAGKVARVDELRWLRVKLGYALVDLQFRLERGEEPFEEICIERDSRLIQQGLFEVQGAAWHAVETSNESPLTRQTLTFSDATESTIVVRGRYLLRSSGVGTVLLPRLNSTGYEVGRRWAAATVEPSLQYEPVGLDRVEVVGPSAFLDAWNAEGDAPALAFRLSSPDASFGVATRPNEPLSSTQWNLDCGYGLDRTVVRYRARIDTEQGYLFQHRISLPDDVSIDDLTLVANGEQNDTPRSVHWTRPRGDQVVVFFDAPVSGPHTLELRGAMPADGRREEPLPLIELADVETESGTVAVFRKPDVTVRLESVTGMRDIGALEATAEEDLGRVQARWVVQGTEPVSANVSVDRNSPQLVAERQNISLRETLEGWTATLDCQLRVEKGVVDTIRLATSELWPGPYEHSPGLTVESVDAERGEVVLRPRAPVQDRIAFAITGPLATNAKGVISVPQLCLKGMHDFEERMVILPVRPEARLNWQVLGLNPAPVPPRFAVETPGTSWIAYQVQRPDFVATIDSVPAAGVIMADNRLGIGADGTVRGVATFDLESGDRESCTLQLSESCRLVAASIDGVPIFPRKIAGSVWEVVFSRTPLPQRLEVVYLGRLSHQEKGSGVAVACPRLGYLPVAATLLTLSGDATYRVAEEGESIPPYRGAMVRLRNVASLIDRATSGGTVSPALETAWYRGWLEVWGDAHRAADRAVTLASRSASVQAERTELSRLTELQEEFAKNEGATGLWESVASGGRRPGSRGDVWDDDAAGGKLRCFLVEGDCPDLTVRIGETAAPADLSSTFWPLLIVAAISLIWLIAWATGRLHRWPHVIGVAAGLCWWLWLWPSAVGLLLAGACLVAAVRCGWRRPRSSGSAIVRLSVSGRS